MDREELFLGDEESALCITVHGHATARYCRELRDKVGAKIEAVRQHISGEQIIVDLTDCSYMDSTFMGLLVTLNRRFCHPMGTSLIVHNPSEQCISLLSEIGLTELITVNRGEKHFPENSERIDSDTEMNADLILKAHEELMGLSEENRRRFSLIHGLLKREAG